MVKKGVSYLLCIMLVFSCFISIGTVSAESEATRKASISYDSIKGFISALESQLKDKDKTEIINMFNISLGYLSNDDYIEDILINIVLGGDADVPSPIKTLVSAFREDYEDEMLFTLCFIKSIQTADRIKALENFKNRVAYTGMTTNQSKALAEIYDELVNDTFQSVLETDYQITDKVILNLFSCVKSYFDLTDDKDNTKKLDLKKINNSSFSKRLSDNMSAHFKTINNVTPNSGEKVLNAIISSVNSNASNDMIANYKEVFGALSMYTKYKSSSSSGGGSPTPRVPSGIPNPDFNQPVPVPPPVAQPQIIATPDAAPIGSSFPDVQNHWVGPYASVLVSRGIIRGYARSEGDESAEGGEIRPEQNMTRQEVAVTIVRALGLEARLESMGDPNFADSDQIQDYAKKAIALLTEMGIFAGYDDGTFRPNDTITREEIITVIGRALNKEANKAEFNFADANQLSSWSYESIRKAYALGIINGYDDNTFRPSKDVTRAEIIKIIYNFMYVQGLL